ncbi:hypothetical protein [Kitasatospora griseola]|uniref:hypothetical protein n=1 Tax=Kitasatospora griseola TaxID=2064 RepID=UPI0036577C3A
MVLRALSPEAASEEYQLFLLDGLCRRPSPVVLVVDEATTAVQVARHLHDDSTAWEKRPPRIGKLLKLDLASLAATSADGATALLSGLAGTDDWIFLPDVDELVDSEVGSGFLTGLEVSVGGGEVAAVIVSTLPERRRRLAQAAPRLIGFATTLAGGKATYTRSVAAPSTNPTDTGWTVVVRYELTGGIQPETDPADLAADGRLHLVETLNLIYKREGEPPLGLLVGLTADAFTASQEDAAFATAELAARRVLGRPLSLGEHITSARGLFYA